jgi:hypothetical protein
LGKAELIKEWKPHMRLLGFSYSDNMFQLAKTRAEFLQFAISVQKNMRADTYKINPSILLRNPFIPPHEQDLLVLANLRRDGVYLHVTTASWWPTDTLAEALDSLKQHALPWYEAWGRPEHLVKVLEAAIREKRRLIDIAEPLPDEATRVPWLQPEVPARVPPSYLRDAAVLQYLNGNLDLARLRTREWMSSLGPSEDAERNKASAQLAALNRIQ